MMALVQAPAQDCNQYNKSMALVSIILHGTGQNNTALRSSTVVQTSRAAVKGGLAVIDSGIVNTGISRFSSLPLFAL